jgi:DNA-3-methyladenine glycosylase I
VSDPTATAKAAADLVVGADGVARCRWAGSAPEYAYYHDHEWGRPVHGADALFERLSLEAFQSGLSWLTILRKRPAFRAAFAGFSIPAVADFGPPDVDRLLADAGIVRNRRKIDAVIANARALAGTGEAGGGPVDLDALVWSFAPPARPAPRSFAEVPASTPESAALAKALKRAGLVFVGPTTMYATMQSCGLVNDHVLGCAAR